MAMNNEGGRLSKETPTIDLRIAGLRGPAHSQIASVWETERDFSESVGFVETGLRSKDHCVLIGDNGSGASEVGAA